MEFGRVQDVDAVNFAMPPDHPYTTQVLATGKGKPSIYVGCAKWDRDDWRGSLYPVKAKKTDYLKHYTSQLNTIELNAMFYRIFPATITERWASYASDSFRFAPKFPQVISHINRLKGSEAATDEFMASLQGFGSKLGHSFLQFDDRFAPKSFDVLKNYLEFLPRDLKVCVEFRHEDWFHDTVVVDETYHLLKELNIGSVITDTSGRRDVLHNKLSTPVAFIRYVGNNLHPTDYQRVDAWIARMKQWIDAGIETIYFFIHNHEELKSPELCRYTIRQLNKVAGTDIAEPMLFNDNPSLF